MWHQLRGPRPGASLRLQRAGLSLFAGLHQLVQSRHGGLTNPDGGEYLSSAEGLAKGTLRVPFVGVQEAYPSPAGVAAALAGAPESTALQHYPPGYPALLAALHVVGLDVFTAARLLGFAAAVALPAVVALVLGRLDVPPIRQALAALAVVVAPDLARWQATGLSDAVFLLGVPVFVLLLHRYLMAARFGNLAPVCMLLSALCLMRFVGLSLVAVLGVAVMRAAWRDHRRAVDLLAVGLSVVPVGVVAALVGAGGPSDRPVVFHPPPVRGQTELVTAVVAQWAVGVPAPVVGAVLLGVGVVAGGLLLRRGARPARVTGLCLVTAGAYLFTVLVVQSWLDAATRLDDRLLMPVHVLLLLALAVDLPAQRAGLRRLVAVVVAVGVGGQLAVAGARLPAAADDRDLLRLAPEMQAVLAAPAGTLVFSNDPNDVWLATRRPVLALPRTLELTTGQPRSDVAERLAPLAQACRTHPCLVVLLPDFDRITPSRAVLDETFPRQVFVRGLATR